VAGCINEIELIGDAVVGLVHHANGVGLDGDAALAFKVHVVKDLSLHLAAGDGAGEFQETVAQRRLAVVDVGDDREVTKETCFHAGVGEGRIRALLRVRRSGPPWHSLSSA